MWKERCAVFESVKIKYSAELHTGIKYWALLFLTETQTLRSFNNFFQHKLNIHGSRWLLKGQFLELHLYK